MRAERDAATAEVARLRGTGMGNLSGEELQKLKSVIKSALEEGMRRLEGEVELPAAKVVKMTNTSLVCPLSSVLIRDQVQAADGYTYERASDEEWIRREHAGASTQRICTRHCTNLTPQERDMRGC